jgi:hypothetical protein
VCPDKDFVLQHMLDVNPDLADFNLRVGTNVPAEMEACPAMPPIQVEAPRIDVSMASNTSPTAMECDNLFE